MALKRAVGKDKIVHIWACSSLTNPSSGETSPWPDDYADEEVLATLSLFASRKCDATSPSWNIPP